MTDAQLSTFENWTFRFRPAQETPARLLVLLHGWTGDENSMGIFSRWLSPRYAVLAPRAPFRALGSGYSWREMKPRTQGLPDFDSLRPSAEALRAFIDAWSPSVGLDAERFDLIGFSQGAALVYVAALLYPERLDKLAALSGFLPAGAEEYLSHPLLAQKRLFVSHGRQDDTIPVEAGRQSVMRLEQASMKVEYCESDGGHKVSKECLRALREFFAIDESA